MLLLCFFEHMLRLPKVISTINTIIINNNMSVEIIIARYLFHLSNSSNSDLSLAIRDVNNDDSHDNSI